MPANENFGVQGYGFNRAKKPRAKTLFISRCFTRAMYSPLGFTRTGQIQVLALYFRPVETCPPRFATVDLWACAPTKNLMGRA